MSSLRGRFVATEVVMLLPKHHDICNKIFSPKIVWKIDWKICWKICWKIWMENLLEKCVGKFVGKMCWKCLAGNVG